MAYLPHPAKGCCVQVAEDMTAHRFPCLLCPLSVAPAKLCNATDISTFSLHERVVTVAFELSSFLQYIPKHKAAFTKATASPQQAHPLL